MIETRPGMVQVRAGPSDTGAMMKSTSFRKALRSAIGACLLAGVCVASAQARAQSPIWNELTDDLTFPSYCSLRSWEGRPCVVPDQDLLSSGTIAPQP